MEPYAEDKGVEQPQQRRQHTCAHRRQGEMLCTPSPTHIPELGTYICISMQKFYWCFLLISNLTVILLGIFYSFSKNVQNKEDWWIWFPVLDLCSFLTLSKGHKILWAILLPTSQAILLISNNSNIKKKISLSQYMVHNTHMTVLPNMLMTSGIFT